MSSIRLIQKVIGLKDRYVREREKDFFKGVYIWIPTILKKASLILISGLCLYDRPQKEVMIKNRIEN